MGTKSKEVYKSVPELIYDTAYRDTENMSIDQLAELMNVERSSLYRALNPYDDKANFPAKLLIPLMRNKKNVSILESMAYSFGYVLVKVPTGSFKKVDEMALITDFQYLCTEVVKQLLNYFNKDNGAEQQKSLVIDLNRVLKHTATIREYITRDVRQIELEFEER